MNLDGSIPSDNPLLNGVRSHIYTYGHRNPPGPRVWPCWLALRLRHGPSTDDELNLIGEELRLAVAGSTTIAATSTQLVGVRATPCRTLKFDNLHPPRRSRSEGSACCMRTSRLLATFFTVPAATISAGSGTRRCPGGLTSTSSAVPGWAASVLITGMRTGAVYRVKLARTAAASLARRSNTTRRTTAIATAPSAQMAAASIVTDSKGVTLDAGADRGVDQPWCGAGVQLYVAHLRERLR
jgi:hypothetical protein